MTTQEVYEKMCADFKSVTGMTINDSSDMAVRLYAAASQIQALYAYSDWTMKQCFYSTAVGERLDEHGRHWGLTRKQAHKAEGILRFAVTELSTADIDIPVGTVCTTKSGIEFETIEQKSITAGKYNADIKARARKTGKSGNVAESSITRMTVPVKGVPICMNPVRFTGGTNKESDAEYRKRIENAISSMPGVGSSAYYKNILLNDDNIAGVVVKPKARGVGTLDIYVSTNAGIPADGEIIEVQNRVNDLREICADILVKKPTAVEKNLDAQLKIKDGFVFEEVRDNVKMKIAARFGGAYLGKNITIDELESIAVAVDGVKNFEIISPTADITLTETQQPVLGTFTVRYWS